MLKVHFLIYIIQNYYLIYFRDYSYYTIFFLIILVEALICMCMLCELISIILLEPT